MKTKNLENLVIRMAALLDRISKVGHNQDARECGFREAFNKAKKELGIPDGTFRPRSINGLGRNRGGDQSI